MLYIVYTSGGCHWCVKAKKLLEKNNLEYIEKQIGIDVKREDFLEKAKMHKHHPSTVPMIFNGGEFIGGYTALVGYLEFERGIKSDV